MSKVTARRSTKGYGRRHRVPELRARLPGKPRPGGIETIRARARESLTEKKGGFWGWCRGKAIIPHYGLASCHDRTKDWRADNARNVAAVLDVLLSYAQVMSGFVGKPRAGGGRYERLNERDFAGLAFNDQGKSAVRLVRDCMAQIVAMGLMKPTKQVRRRVEETNEIRSAAGVRVLNLELLARLTGCWHVLKSARQAIERKRGTRPASAQNDSAPNVIVAGELDAAASVDADRDRPPTTGDPPAEKVLAKFEEMKELAAGG